MDSIRLADFVGLPSALGWSHVATISNETGARSIICFAVSGTEASAIGHEVVAILRSTLVESEEALYELIISLNAKTQERSSRLSIAAGFLDGDRCAWITIGGVVGLQRNDRFGRVLTSDDLQMRIGHIRPNDIFVLTTAAAAGMVDDIAELFQQGFQLSGVESSLERLIRTQPQQDQSALALIELVSAKAVTPEPTEPPLQSLTDAAVVQIEQSFSQTTTESAAPNEMVIEPTIAQVSPTAKKKSATVSGALAAGLMMLQRGPKKLRPVGGRFKRSLARWSTAFVVFSRRFYFALARAFRQIPWRSWRDSKRVRLIAVIVGVLLLVLIASIITISWQQRRAAASASEAVSPFQQQLTTIKEQAVTNPIQAQAALTELTTQVSEQILAAPSKATAAGLQNFLAQVRQYEDVLKGEQAVRSLPVVMDLQTVVPGFVATLADGSGGDGIYVDLAKKVAIIVNFASKETRQFDLSSLDTIKSISMRSPTEAVILSNGIYSLQLTEGAVPVQVKPEGDSNRAATLISSYDNYVYVFNPEKRNIFRHLVRKDGYSDPIGWLLSPLGMPAESVYAMKVDGDVWLGTKDGQLKKYTSGRSTSFAPNNLEQPLEGPVQPYVSEVDQYLYAFVPSQQRVVVMTKDGTFVKQIKSEVLSGALAVVAHEAASLLYAISGSVIYQAPL